MRSFYRDPFIVCAVTLPFMVVACFLAYIGKPYYDAWQATIQSARNRKEAALAAYNAQQAKNAEIEAVIAKPVVAEKVELPPIDLREMPHAAKIFITFRTEEALRKFPGVQDFKITALDVMRLKDDPRKLEWIWQASISFALAMKPEGPNFAPQRRTFVWTTVFRFPPKGSPIGECWRESTDTTTGKTTWASLGLCEFTPEFRAEAMTRWNTLLKNHNEIARIVKADDVARLEIIVGEKLAMAEDFNISVYELQEILEATD
jgi:hypothetical protein